MEAAWKTSATPQSLLKCTYVSLLLQRGRSCKIRFHNGTFTRWALALRVYGSKASSDSTLDFRQFPWQVVKFCSSSIFSTVNCLMSDNST